MSNREVEQMTGTERLERAGVEVEHPDAEAEKTQVLIRAILALEKLHEDPQSTYEDMARAVLSLVSDGAEWWVSERLELQGESREANASEAAAIERARRAERAMRTVEEVLAEAAECGVALSPGRLAALSAQLHNAFRTPGAPVRPKAISRGATTFGVYWRRTHLIFFSPCRPWGNGSSWGAHLRWHRASGNWWHVVVRLFHRAEPIPGATGCWQWEVEQFETKKASRDPGGGNRLTIKRFIRLRIGLGGKATKGEDDAR